MLTIDQLSQIEAQENNKRFSVIISGIVDIVCSVEFDLKEAAAEDLRIKLWNYVYSCRKIGKDDQSLYEFIKEDAVKQIFFCKTLQDWLDFLTCRYREWKRERQ